MKLDVFSIYDNVTDSYSQPFMTSIVPDNIIALRVFSNMIKEGSMLYDSPYDYSLVHIGTFDDKTGIYNQKDMIKTLIYAYEVIEARKDSKSTHDIAIKLSDIKNAEKE